MGEAQKTEYINFEIIEKSIKEFSLDNFDSALSVIEKAINSFSENYDKENLAVSIALRGLYSYFWKNQPFIKVMRDLENAKFLANSIKKQKVLDNINYCFAKILFEEKNYEIALQYLKAIKNKEDLYFNYEELLSAIETASNYNLNDTNPMIALLNIAKTISSKTDIDSLLKTIADETTYSLNAERCSVFIIDKETKELWSKVATGLELKEIRFPMDKGLAGYVATTGETINIKNAYSDNRFNKEIDQQTGYHTKNILCMPIRNMHFEIIGVLQVLNKIGGYFSEYDEKLLVTIGMNAGIAIENSRLFEKQEQMLIQEKQLFSSFIDTLVASIDARDKITSGHSARVKRYAQILCEEMGINQELSNLIEQAAILHDIGKIGIKDSILQKEGKLTLEEYSHIQEHAKITFDILSKIYNTKDTEQISIIAASHHEKFDGTGYYKGLKGNEIPLGGRILAVADVFDSITSKRHYRDKMPIKEVISIISENSGTHFDPEITKYFLNISCDKILEILSSDANSSISEEEKEYLKKFSLQDMYSILNKSDELRKKSEKIAVDIFNKYYKSVDK